MDIKGYQHYKQDSINTMTQGELLLLVFDELVKRLTLAELMLTKEDFPSFEAATDKSLEIVRYLDHTLDRIYDFICYDLSRIKTGRNRTELERVKKMAMELRESFRQADKQQGGK